MNALAEALGMSLPGSAAIPAPYRERGQMAYETGMRIVDMVWEDLKPSDIMTREAFENVIVANAAIGGSTNAPIHINAIAKHIGVQLDCDDWEKIGFDMPLLVNMQPAGVYLGEEYFRAGGLPAVIAELIEAGKIHEGALTATARTIGENCRGKFTWDREVIRSYDKPLKEKAGFLNLKGTLFDSAIMKTSVISRGVPGALSRRSEGPERLRGPGRGVRRAGGLPPPHRRSGARHRRAHDPDHARRRADRLSGRRRGGEHAAARRADPAGRAFAALHRRRPPVRHLGHALDPQRLAGGGGRRRARAAADRRPRPHRPQQAHAPTSCCRRRSSQRRRARTSRRSGGYAYPASQTPWQEIQRSMVDQLSEGMVLKPAVKYQKVAQTFGAARQPLAATEAA